MAPPVEGAQPADAAPEMTRFLVRIASLEMHPLDTLDRAALVADEGGQGFCNITKCCRPPLRTALEARPPDRRP
jgi:hypothetical protein